MQTIIIVLNPGKLTNPDLDLRYLIPDRVSEITEGAVRDNGYDYIDCEAPARCWEYGSRQRTPPRAGLSLTSCSAKRNF